MNKELLLKLDQVLIDMMRKLRKELSRTGVKQELTRGQVYLLRFVKKGRQKKVSDLAVRMDVSPSAISELMDGLERQGYITRDRDEKDRRVILPRLTSEGEGILREMDEVRIKIIAKYASNISPEELKTLVNLVEKFTGKSVN